MQLGVATSFAHPMTLGFVVVQFYVLLFLLAIQSYRYSRSLTQSQSGAGATDATSPQSISSNFDPAYT
ncbi:hypothetical protein HOLleu_32650 [Holothuria leucospilota]|uniref:Uncharacterized protein n=1 Tax=Holothuria leucospilota TaxID=206669 RepID=A0A9Q1GZ65_HOLLE|nr:hypothetical protein HOLleu_32650 [Holothuria leucospilota]